MKSTLIGFAKGNISTVSAQTGDNLLWILVLMLVVLCTSIMLFVYKKSTICISKTSHAILYLR